MTIIPEDIQGWMTTTELRWLQVQADKCHVIIEIGVWKGRSTLALSENCHGIVYGIDPYITAVSDQRSDIISAAQNNLQQPIKQGKCFLIDATSIQALPLMEKLLWSRKADMVFIDGDHTTDAVSYDIEQYRKLIRRGGILAGHDRDYIEVQTALQSLIPDYKNGAGSIWYTEVQE